MSQTPSLFKQFTAAARQLVTPEFPKLMRTMRFRQQVDVPYTVTTFTSPIFIGYDALSFPRYKKVIHDPPVVENKSYSATRYNWYEARRHETSEGMRYEVCGVMQTIPGLNAKQDIEDVKIADDNGKTRLYTKTETLAYMARLDAALAREQTIDRDAGRTKRYFGKYRPAPGQ
ncbi:MAG: hypothetical protein ACAH83_13940 [Alphaproteobacteria bacterium]